MIISSFLLIIKSWFSPKLTSEPCLWNFTWTDWAISLTLSGYNWVSSCLTWSSNDILNFLSRSTACRTSMSWALSASTSSNVSTGEGLQWIPSSAESEDSWCSVLSFLTNWCSCKSWTSCCPFAMEVMSLFNWCCWARSLVFSCSRLSMYSAVCCSIAACFAKHQENEVLLHQITHWSASS